MFNRAFAKVIEVEGGFSDNPFDSGGKTKFGITEGVARANGYYGEMRDLDLLTAKRIYERQYWDTLHLHDVAICSYPVAEEMFDTGVNCGVGVAGEFLQRALNALNRRQRDYADLKVDGVVGPVTLRALALFLQRRQDKGEEVLLKALNCLQGERYIRLAERREKDEEFLFGWLLHRVNL